MLRLFALAALALLICVPPASAGFSCKPNPITSGWASNWPSRKVGRQAAIDKWKTKVTQYYGQMYSNFANAKSRDIDCQQATNAFGANAWKCKVRGRPCIISH